MVATIAAPAFAGSWTVNAKGGQTVVSGSTISLKDTGDEGRFVGVNYRYDNGQTQTGFSNKNGYGYTVSKTAPSTITNSQNCISRGFPLPMDCGAWRW